jgi:hypothetical protein
MEINMRHEHPVTDQLLYVGVKEPPTVGFLKQVFFSGFAEKFLTVHRAPSSGWFEVWILRAGHSLSLRVLHRLMSTTSGGHLLLGEPVGFNTTHVSYLYRFTQGITRFLLGSVTSQGSLSASLHDPQLLPCGDLGIITVPER